MNLSIAKTSLTYREGLREIPALRDRGSYQLRLEDAGHVGFGESAPLTGWTESPETCYRRLSEIDPDNSQQIRDAETKLTDCPAARHGLSQARLDLTAKRNGLSLAEELADRTIADPTVPVYYSVVGDSLNSQRDQIVQGIKAGFDHFKFKTQQAYTGTLNRVNNLFSSTPGNWHIRVDANENWSSDQINESPPDSLRERLTYFEQPLPRNDVEGLAELQGKIPVALDESVVKYGPEQLLRKYDWKYWIIKPMALGGLDVARDSVLSALHHGITPILTTLFEGIIGRLGTIHLAASLEELSQPCGLATGVHTCGDSGWDIRKMENGTITLPETPGIGLPESAMT